MIDAPGPGTPPRRRVACYVVREGSAGPELLVFDHVDVPEAGTQVPAGGMEPGESVEEAALREVAEETGLTGARVVRLLGVSDRAHPETGAPQDTTYVLMRYDARSHQPAEPWTWEVEGAGEDGGMLFQCWFTPLPLDRWSWPGTRASSVPPPSSEDVPTRRRRRMPAAVTGDGHPRGAGSGQTSNWPASRRSLTSVRKRAASAPSTSRWS